MSIFAQKITRMMDEKNVMPYLMENLSFMKRTALIKYANRKSKPPDFTFFGAFSHGDFHINQVYYLPVNMRRRYRDGTDKRRKQAFAYRFRNFM